MTETHPRTTRAPALHRLAACSACGRQFDVSASPELARLGEGDELTCSCGARVTVPALPPQDAAVVACSSCGAPREGRAAACTYCGSAFTLRELDLDAICPYCFARVSRRGRFCHHCAQPITAPRADAAPAAHRCPTCRVEEGSGEAGEGRPLVRRPLASRPLTSRPLQADAAVPVFECDRCAGLWLDREVFELLVERVKRQRSGLGRPAPGGHAVGGPAPAPAPSPAALPPLPGPPAVGAGVPTPAPATTEGGRRVSSALAERQSGWAYRPCVVCSKLMNRRQYAAKSGVILDVCREHGLWFDVDELHQVLEWVRTGGPTDADVEAARVLRRASGRDGPSLGPSRPMGGGGWAEPFEEGGWGGWGFDLWDVLVHLVGMVVGERGSLFRR